MRTVIFLGLYCIACAIRDVPVFNSAPSRPGYALDDFSISIFFGIFVGIDIFLFARKIYKDKI